METKQVNSYIGQKIRDLRNRNGLTLQELADRSELTKGFLSQLERGQVSPSVVTLFDLIECLGSTPSEFFQEEEEQIVYSEDQYFEKIDEKIDHMKKGAKYTIIDDDTGESTDDINAKYRDDDGHTLHFPDDAEVEKRKRNIH